MNYLPLALITMVFLGVHYFLVKLVSPHVASPVLALLSAVVVIPVVLAYIYFTGTPIVPQQKIYWVYAILISIPAAVAILALYMAIDRGPVSVVMPIYGLNGMMTAFLGVLILRESVTVERVVGLILAVAAIVLLSR